MFPEVPLTDVSEAYIELKEPRRAYYDYMSFGGAPPQSPVVVSGFRQSPLYFPGELERITPDWDSALGGPLIRSMIERMANLDSDAEKSRTVSIHIRMGDYLKLPHHQVDLGPYYMKALQSVRAGSRLHLFSDEPERCFQPFAAYAQANGLTFTVAKPRSDVESMYEMSLCRGGNIVANSTFSWWGAWYAHQAGSPWATYPNNWGQGMPEPTDLFPVWATVLPV